MPSHVRLRRLGHGTRDRTRRRDQVFEVEVDRPAHDHEHGEDRRGRHRSRRRLRAPGDRNARGDERGERGERERIVPARQHQQPRRDQIGGERGRRHAVDLPGVGVGSEIQAGHDQGRRQCEADDDMENMGAERVDADHAASGQGPQRAGGDRRDRQPAPQPDARERKGGGGHHRDVDVERPVVGPVGGDEQRRDIGAEEAEPGERRSVQQGGGERRQRHQAEQDEGHARRQEAVERVGGVDVGIGDGGAGRRQDARNMRRRQAGDAGELLAPAGPFAGDDERSREQRAERDPHAGAEQALRDRVAHEKDAAERHREPADPDRPLRAEAFLEAHGRRRGLRGRRGRRRWGRGRGRGRLEFGRRDRRDGFGRGRRGNGFGGAATAEPGTAAARTAAAPPRRARASPPRARAPRGADRRGAIARRARPISPARRWR